MFITVNFLVSAEFTNWIDCHHDHVLEFLRFILNKAFEKKSK